MQLHEDGWRNKQWAKEMSTTVRGNTENQCQKISFFGRLSEVQKHCIFIIFFLQMNTELVFHSPLHVFVWKPEKTPSPTQKSLFYRDSLFRNCKLKLERVALIAASYDLQFWLRSCAWLSEVPAIKLLPASATSVRNIWLTTFDNERKQTEEIQCMYNGYKSRSSKLLTAWKLHSSHFSTNSNVNSSELSASCYARVWIPQYGVHKSMSDSRGSYYWIKKQRWASVHVGGEYFPRH